MDQTLDGDRTDPRIILHHENCLATIGLPVLGHISTVYLVRTITGIGQIEADGGTKFEFAVDFHETARLFGKPVHHAQSEAGPFAGLLGGKERFQNPCLRFC